MSARAAGGAGASRHRAAALRRARARAGLSQRELASRLGISWVAVCQAEHGSDLRHSTLKSFLRALPGLAPHDLLPAGREPSTVDREEVWRYYRDVMGVEAHEVERVTLVRANGDREDRLTCRGLRSIRSEPGELKLLHGLERAAFEGAPSVLREIAAESRRDPEGRTVKTRVLQQGDGRFLHQLVVPPDLAREGLTYSWSKLRKGLALTRAESAARRGFPSDEPVHSGFLFAPNYPVRRLKLEVRYPAGYWPARLYVRVWPEALPPDPEVRDLAQDIHPEGLSLRCERRRGRASCRVRLPLMGVSYNVGWELP